MQNFIQKGCVLDFIPEAAVKSGDVVVVGEFVGVAVKDAAIAEPVAVNLTGVYSLPKGTGALTVGSAVYWDPATKKVTATAGSLKLAGHVFNAASSADGFVNVRLSN